MENIKTKPSELTFQLMVESAPNALILVNKEGRIAFSNAHAEMLFGYKKAELLGKSIEILIPQRFSGHHPALRDSFFHKPEARSMGAGRDLFALKKDGTEFPVEIGLNPLATSEGTMVLAAIIDISERKKAEELLRTGEKLYRSLFENLHQGFALCKVIYEGAQAVDFTYVTVNAAYEALTGLKNITGKNLSEVIPGLRESEPEYLEMLGKISLGGETMKFENFVPALDRWFAMTIYCPENGYFIGLIDNITEKRQAEEKIRESEIRFRALVENEFSITSLMNEKFEIIYRSPSSETILGWTPEERKNIATEIINHPDDAEYNAMKMQEVLANPGKQVDMLMRRKHKDGNYIWLEGIVVNKLDDPIIHGIVANFRDITAKKEAEDLVEKSEKRFRAILENNNDAIMLYDANGMIIYQSPAVERISGYSLDEMKNKSEIDLYHPDYIESRRERILEALKRPGIPLYGINRLRHKDGHYIWTEGTSTNLLEDENVRAIVGNFRDITARKEAEELVEKSEKKFRAILENNNDAITLIDSGGNVLYLSPATERIIGYTLEDCGGMVALDFFHPDESEEVNLQFEMAMKNPGVPIPSMNRLRHKDGYYVWTEGTTTNMLGDENVRAIVGNFRDITERKIAEGKILKANKLYSFLSHINQAIVHHQNEQSLFDEVCRVSTEIGKFDSAWIGVLDESCEHINMVAHKNIQEEDLSLFRNNKFDINGPTGSVLKLSKYFRGNVDKAPDSWKGFASKNNLNSFMILPINKAGKMKGTLNIYSSVSDFFDEQEIALLVEAAGDISFALDVFEKEKKLSQSESRLKAAQEMAHLGYWDLSFATGKAIWSPEACAIYGLSPEDNVHTYADWINFIYPDDLEEVSALNKEAEKTLGRSSFYHRITRGDGSIGYIHSQSRFEFDSIGKPVGLSGVVYDFTEIKKAEEELINSRNELGKNEKRLKGAQQLAHLGDWEYNLDTRDVLWSDELYRIYGYEPGGIKPSIELAMSFVHPDDQDRIKETVSNSLETFTPFNHYRRILLHDGSVKHIQATGQFDFDNKGKAVRFHGTLLDITDIAEKEEELKNSEIRFREFFDNAPEAITILDLNKGAEFIAANNNALDLLKYDLKDFVGKTPVDISPEFQPDGSLSSEKAIEYIRSAMNGEKTVFEWALIDAEGREFISEARLATLPGMGSGNLMTSFVDITDRKNAENLREKMTADLIQRNKDLEQFTYIISHNLRAPVANIIGVTNILQSPELDEQKQSLMLNNLSTSVGRLDGVIKDLNFILQIKREVSEKNEMIKFSKIVEDIKISIENLISIEHAEIVCDFSEVDEFFALRSYLYSVFYNLISNSIKYRQPGISPVIMIKSAREGNKIILTFKDNGLGIDLKKKGDHVFGLYKRFHQHTEGKGMGLFMTKTQVETMGGSISISSEVNKGTEFKIEFETSI